MKKLCAITLLLSSAAFAGHEEGVRWGIGGRAGVAAFAGKICSAIQVNRDAAALPVTNFYKQIDTIKPGAISFQGGAFAEVGYRSCDYSFGALIDVNGDTLKSTGLNDAFIDAAGNQQLNQFCVKAPLHIGGDIRAGKYFGDALWYFLIGGEGIRMQYNHYFSDSTLLGNAAMPTAAVPVIFGLPCATNDSCTSTTSCATSCATSCNTNSNDCNSFWRGALRVGTGIEYNWSDCFNVKLEYRFLWAGKKQICLASPVVAGFAGGNAANAQALATDTLYFRQSVAALMLSYQF